MERPITDESLCFVCQDSARPIEWIATRNKEQFNLCTRCKNVVEADNRVHNNVVYALADKKYLLAYTLGVDLNPILITFKRITKRSDSTRLH